jgi:hypothetical protein
MDLVLRAGGGKRDSWSEVEVTAEVGGGVGPDFVLAATAGSKAGLSCVCFFCWAKMLCPITPAMTSSGSIATANQISR